MNIIQTTKGWSVLDNDSHYAVWVEQNGKLEDNFLAPLVASHLKEGDCIMDIGACYGDHTICYSRAVGKDGLVIACEAGALAFECLKKNIEQFPFRNVFPILCCVSENCGDSVSHSMNTNVGASVCNEVARKDLKEGEKYIMTVTIDFLAHEAKRKIDFIKLDIEGFECKALIGASATLRRDKPSMLIELNEAALMLQGDTQEDIFHILNVFGYNWSICQPECSLASPQYDILCIPKP